MKKQELLNLIDENLLDKLFGFCYARTQDSHEAGDLCSDIVFALVKIANTDGEIANPHPFIWQVARNVYADFSEKRHRRDSAFFGGDSDEILSNIADAESEGDDSDSLTVIYRRIAFLTRAYREVMIMYYLEGKSTAEIARLQNTSEGAIRQRLFSAREKIKSEVNNMNNNIKPMVFNEIDYYLCGEGNPGWGDPRETLQRQFSKQVLRLCQSKPRSATEIAEELGVPTIYVEEELEILKNGTNGQYGVLKKLDNGKYTVNIVLLDKKAIEEAFSIYNKYAPKFADELTAYLKKNQHKYTELPYINKQLDLNAIYWKSITEIPFVICDAVEKSLYAKHFKNIDPPTNRHFNVYGHDYVEGMAYLGCDSTRAANLFGYSSVTIHNIYILPTGGSKVPKLEQHFSCFHNISTDLSLQLAIRAINGLSVNSLSEKELEAASHAMSHDYIYRDGDMLYTKILTFNKSDSNKMNLVDCEISDIFSTDEIEALTDEMYEFIISHLPKHLMPEWRYVNYLAHNVLCEKIILDLINSGLMTVPTEESADTCWMVVEK